MLAFADIERFVLRFGTNPSLGAFAIGYQSANERLGSDVELLGLFHRRGRVLDFDRDPLHTGFRRDTRIGRTYPDLVISQIGRRPTQIARVWIELHTPDRIPFELVLKYLPRIGFLGCHSDIHFQAKCRRDEFALFENRRSVRRRKDISPDNRIFVFRQRPFDPRCIITRCRLNRVGILQRQDFAIERDSKPVRWIVVGNRLHVESRDSVQVVFGVKRMQKLGCIFNRSGPSKLKTEGLVEILLNRVARRLRERIGQIALIGQVDQPFEILCPSLLFVARQGLADETIEFRFGDRAGSQLKLLFIALLRQIEF